MTLRITAFDFVGLTFRTETDAFKAIESSRESCCLHGPRLSDAPNANTCPRKFRSRAKAHRLALLCRATGRHGGAARHSGRLGRARNGDGHFDRAAGARVRRSS